MFDETGAGNQDTLRDVRGDELDPAAGPVPAVRVVAQAADWLRPGAAPFSPFSGTQYMAAGADSRGYKRLRQDVRPHRHATAPKLTFKFSADVEEDWDWVAVEAHVTPTDSDAWTTLADRHRRRRAGPELTTDSTGESCPEGLATDADAPHPFLSALLERRTARAQPATGTPSRAPPAAGPTGPSTSRPTRARRSRSRSA